LLGSTGAAGTSGTSGTTPPNFTSGTAGSAGSGGTSGLNGTFFGSSGTTGTAGSAGTSGTSFYGVTSGTSGTSALGFTSGTSGTASINTSGTSGFASLSGVTDNGVLTLEGSSPNVRVEDNMTFDGTRLSITGNILSSTYISSTTFRETYSDQGTGGSVTFDLSTANNFRRQFNGTATISFSNVPASNAFGFTLVLVNAGAYSITWPSIKWAGGTTPILTSSGTDVIVIYTYNGGTTYYGFVTGKNLS